MSVLNNFANHLTATNTSVSGSVVPALESLSSGVARGQSIIYAIQTYGLDMTRAQAAGAVAIVNARIATVKAQADAIEAIDFATLWPEDAGDTITEVIANELLEEDPE